MLGLQHELNGYRNEESGLGATGGLCDYASLVLTFGQGVLKDIQLPGIEAERESKSYG